MHDIMSSCSVQAVNKLPRQLQYISHQLVVYTPQSRLTFHTVVPGIDR